MNDENTIVTIKMEIMDDISHIAQSLPPPFTISLSISSSIRNLPISSIFILLSP